MPVAPRVACPAAPRRAELDDGAASPGIAVDHRAHAHGVFRAAICASRFRRSSLEHALAITLHDFRLPSPPLHQTGWVCGPAVQGTRDLDWLMDAIVAA